MQMNLTVGWARDQAESRARDWEQIGADDRICALIYEYTSPPDLQLPFYLQLLL